MVSIQPPDQGSSLPSILHTTATLIFLKYLFILLSTPSKDVGLIVFLKHQVSTDALLQRKGDPEMGYSESSTTDPY